MPGKRMTDKQLTRGAMAIAEAPLQTPTIQELAKVMGVSTATAYAKLPLLQSVVEKWSNVKKEQLGEIFLSSSLNFLASANDPAKVRKASTRDLMWSSAVAYDKYALATGQATQHVHHLHEITSREEVARKLVDAGILKDLGILDVVGTPLEAGYESEGSKQNR